MQYTNSNNILSFAIYSFNPVDKHFLESGSYDKSEKMLNM